MVAGRAFNAIMAAVSFATCAVVDSHFVAESAPGLILLQTTGSVSKSVNVIEPVIGETAVAGKSDNNTDLSSEVRSLRRLILDMRSSIEKKVGACCHGCGSGGNEHASPGLCAAFGDPHFTTFDGAHTILLKDMTLWLVKSQRVWIQGLSLTSTGNFMGVAVSGPFMKNHTLIIYNNTVENTTNPSKFTVLFDGQPILTEWDAEGRTEFSEPFILWAARRSEWNTSMHDKAILEIDPAIDFSVGPWPSRFSGAPKGGLYLFRFPDGVEITVTGVDFMSAVIKMKPQKGGQAGYCGNFDNSASDEFEPPVDGTVPEVLVPAWNTAVGESLEPVPEEDNLFGYNAPPDLAYLVRKISAGAKQPGARLPEACRNNTVLQEAADRCKDIPDQNMRLNCVIDICTTGNAAIVDDIGSADILEDKVNAQGVAQFVGLGMCRGSGGTPIRALKTSAVRSGPACQDLLREFAPHVGVVGAQLMVQGTCEVLIKSGVDIQKIKRAVEPAGGWKNSIVDDNGGDYVDGVKVDLSWSCWKLH